jgi:hypothetical protein
MGHSDPMSDAGETSGIEGGAGGGGGGGRSADGEYAVPFSSTSTHTRSQGLTLVHVSAQLQHFLPHVEGCFAGFRDKNGSG